MLSVSVKMDEKVPYTTIPGPDETANTALTTCYDLAVHLQPLRSGHPYAPGVKICVFEQIPFICAVEHRDGQPWAIQSTHWVHTAGG